MNNETSTNKNPDFLDTKKGAFTILLLVFCASLTFACSLGMFAPTHVYANSTALFTNLIDLENTELPFEVERDDVLYMTATSFEADLNVTIKNQDDEIVTDYPFTASLSLVDSENEPITVTDTDKDGLIYFDELDAGDYTLELSDSGDYDTPEPLTVTIEPPVEYKVVDVSDKIVSQDTVVLAAEDGQYSKDANDTVTTVPEPTDTVEFVESRTEIIEGTEQALLDEAGNQIYYYIPVLGGVDNMYLTTTDSTGVIVTELLAVCDENGYLIKAKKLIPDTSATLDEETGDATGEDTIEDIPEYEDVQVIDSLYNLMTYDGKDINAEQITATITTPSTTVYYGWQTIDNRTYYFDKNGNTLTGLQTIQGIDYVFNDDGSITDIIGIDVSYWQSDINWTKVKASGVDFVIIRVGFMGWGSGALVEDSTFARNLAGAKAAGLKVGAYFFDVAITAQEAVEEASMCIQMLAGQSLDYPVFIDMEYASSTARNNDLTAAQRTIICDAFCSTIRNSGYKAGVYASSSYLYDNLNMSTLSKYYVWVANWNVAAPSYGGRYDIWQYSESGTVDGITGAVDMNISYMGY